MNIAKYIHRIVVVCLLFLSVSAFSQDADLQKNKVIIDGKAYYLHVVKKGEGFYGIARQFGVSQKEIHDANPNSLFGLKPGDVLYIPIISGRNSSSGEMEESTEFIYHTIEKGQTLYFLSKKYNVSIDKIKKYNIGADQNLLVGTIFKIPVEKGIQSETKEQVQYVYHEVEPKETLYGISKKYNVSIQELLQSNPALQNGVIAMGSKIRIPQSQTNKVVAEDKEKINIQDDHFLYHRIQLGDTFFSLSKKYRVSREDIAKANPDLNPDDLALDFLIRIPKEAMQKREIQQQQSDDFVIHVVKRKETLYSIAHKYQVSIDELKEANPTLILNNIRKGTELRIPTQSYLARKKMELEQADLVTDQSEDRVMLDSVYVDCGLYDYNVLKETINVVLMLPFDIEATQKDNIITKIENGEEIERKRQVPVLSSRSRSFVEFYEGALMAIDSLKKQGVNIHLFTYDTAPDTNRVKEILKLPELKQADFIIGPAYTSNLALVSDFSYKNGIKLIYPLSNKGAVLNKNPWLFQVNPPDTLLFKKYANHIINQQNGTRILVLKSAKPNDIEERLCKTIRDQLYMRYIPLGQVPDYQEITFSAQDVQGIEALLDKEHQNVVVIPSTDEADVSKIITTLHGVVESSQLQVKLIGFGNWLVYQTINAEEIHDLDTEILTTYAIDYKDNATINFIHKFREWYHTEPFPVAPYFIRPDKNSQFSKYGIWGFDVAYYFLSARVKYGKQFEYCLNDFYIPQVQFNLHFKRSENWGGFYNEGLYVIRFRPSLEVSREVIR